MRPPNMQSDCSAGHYSLLRQNCVNPSEARDRHFAANCRSLASLGMTIHKKGDNYLGYWKEYPLASFPDMNLVLYSSK